MSNQEYSAWVSYGSDVQDLKTHTLAAYITVPFEVGTRLLTGDGTGNTCEGTVIFIQDQLVTILFDDSTKSWAKS